MNELPTAVSPTTDLPPDSDAANAAVSAAAPPLDALAQREADLAKMLMSYPDDPDLLVELGRLRIQQNRDREAADSFRIALSLHPEHRLALLELALVLHAYPAFQDEAITLLQRCIELDATTFKAYRPLAVNLNQAGRHAEATTVLRAWCAAAPDDPAAAHLLAAYSQENVPDHASDAFLQRTFDAAAEKFDVTLRDLLHYRAPNLLSAHLDTVLPAALATPTPTLDVLDMGCGTGLCAEWLKPRARRLVGVDLSEKMLAKAQERDVYDVLENVELMAYLDACRGQFDLLFATDLFIYRGHLLDAFRNAFAALRKGGHLAFTVELLVPVDDTPSPPDWALTTTGRYQHTERYLRAALSAAGFSPPQIIEIELRTELNVAVMGLAVVAASAGASS